MEKNLNTFYLALALSVLPYDGICGIISKIREVTEILFP